MTPNEEVIPAVQLRLHALLSHEQLLLFLISFLGSRALFRLHSSHVKCRALLAIHIVHKQSRTIRNHEYTTTKLISKDEAGQPEESYWQTTCTRL